MATSYRVVERCQCFFPFIGGDDLTRSFRWGPKDHLDPNHGRKRRLLLLSAMYVVENQFSSPHFPFFRFSLSLSLFYSVFHVETIEHRMALSNRVVENKTRPLPNSLRISNEQRRARKSCALRCIGHRQIIGGGRRFAASGVSFPEPFIKRSGGVPFF